MTAPTVRRYPRSLAEAFPDVRASAFEGPERRAWHPAERWLLPILLAVQAGIAWGVF